MPAPSTPALARAAAVAYAANCALGAAVQLRIIDTSRDRRVHHALYIVTSTLTAVAILAGLARRSAPGLVLVPAVVPLALLPFIGHDGHVGTAGAAAPWYVGALLVEGE